MMIYQLHLIVTHSKRYPEDTRTHTYTNLERKGRVRRPFFHLHRESRCDPGGSSLEIPIFTVNKIGIGTFRVGCLIAPLATKAIPLHRAVDGP